MVPYYTRAWTRSIWTSDNNNNNDNDFQAVFFLRLSVLVYVIVYSIFNSLPVYIRAGARARKRLVRRLPLFLWTEVLTRFASPSPPVGEWNFFFKTINSLKNVYARAGLAKYANARDTLDTRHYLMHRCIDDPSRRGSSDNRTGHWVREFTNKQNVLNNKKKVCRQRTDVFCIYT